MNTSHNWVRRWFELKDGIMRHADSSSPADYESSTFIPIENIIRLVTSVCYSLMECNMDILLLLCTEQEW